MEKKILDYISGQMVKRTPEELEAVQPFSKILVEDYNYPKENIQTRPQYRVKVRPSDVKKSYPVDIAVFTSAQNRNEDNIKIIVECKCQKNNEGEGQLKDYLRFSKANLGIFYNGKVKKCYLKKESKGRINFLEIPDIPKYKETLEDIGSYKRRDLIPTYNLKQIFIELRNVLAANATKTTRDEEIAKQILNIIFCKLFDEIYTEPNDKVRFIWREGEGYKVCAERIKEIFQEVKTTRWKDIFNKEDSIDIDDASICSVVAALQKYSIYESKRDVLADAFEIFIGKSLKGEQGQFFTPRNIVEMCIEIMDPGSDDKIIDPACGTGGFISSVFKYVSKKIEKRFSNNSQLFNEEKFEYAMKKIFGIEKDAFLAKVAKAYMAILGDGRSGIHGGIDSLDYNSWNDKAKEEIKNESFDMVFTNPPFGSKIPVRGEQKLKNYNLAYDARKKLKKEVPPQVLFIEKCINLAKPGGKISIVLPEGIFGNTRDQYIREYILKKCDIFAIIDLPFVSFSPYTTTKTCVLFLIKKPNNKYKNVFIDIPDTCGHDRRGKPTNSDDIATVGKRFHLENKNDN